jgi:hypothetical protein
VTKRHHLALAAGLALLFAAALITLSATRDSHPDLSFARKTDDSYAIAGGLIGHTESYDLTNVPRNLWLPEIQQAAADAGLSPGAKNPIEGTYRYEDSKRSLMLFTVPPRGPKLIYVVRPVSRFRAVVGALLMRLRNGGVAASLMISGEKFVVLREEF